jgi:diguanylate cyclase (GGDEF)-like protein/PAS domain S-box-containing protein
MDDEDARLRLAMDAVGMTTWDSSVVDGEIVKGLVFWSEKGAALLGLDASFLVQAFPELLRYVHPEDVAHVLDTLQCSADALTDYELQYRVIRADGALRWLRAKAQVVPNEEGVAIRTLGLVWDVTAAVEKDIANIEAMQISGSALASIADGVVITDTRGKVQYLNKAAEDITGWTTGTAAGTDVGDILRVFDEATGMQLETITHSCLQRNETIGLAPGGRLATRDGRMVALDESAAPIWSSQQKLLGAVTVFRDVTHQRSLSAEISWQASHDPLTGLLNRREFENRVAAALHAAKSDRIVHTLLYIDLDQFKLVNDTAGHAAGDALLQQLTQLLQSRMRESDVLARLGGDELGVLLSHCALDQGYFIAEQIRETVRTFTFTWDSRAFVVGASIGIVAITPETTSVSELLVAADEACYAAKAQGRNRVHVHHVSDELLARRHRETVWVARLDDAIRNARLRLHAMPIHSLKGGQPDHQEVLLRLMDSGVETLPEAFIPAAERYNMMPAIDRWVIAEVCRYIATADAAESGAAPLADAERALSRSYSINLSGLSLVDEQLYDFIVQQFLEYRIEPGKVCFEITETAVIANVAKAQALMARLSALGCRFSLDDFGSGLSSFAYLRTLPVHYLKIDGIFVKGIADDPVNRAMVEAIHKVGQVIGLQTVAEYVEDEETLAVVREIGIDFAQGYAIGRPHAMTPGSGH